MSVLELSVSIISFNEEANIGACLDAIKDIAAEIIVVDSQSTDRTVEIAKTFGAQVFTEEWKGHIAQKNSALGKCTQRWILSLDCDEIISPELKSSIVSALSSPDFDGYQVNRKTFFLGRWLNHAWQPDWNLRLVKKGIGHWQGLDPHDSLAISATAGKLSGDLLHYSFRDLRDCLERTIRYARISAESYDAAGKRFSWAQLLLNPVHGFVKQYFIKRGFLDGMPGFIAASIHFIYVFLKYAFIFERQQLSTTHRKH